MNFDNEKFSPNLYKIASSKLLLLDFGKFDKKDYSYICQDFDDSFYQALLQLADRLRHYKRLVLLFVKGTKHPRSTCDSFRKFCADREFMCEVREDVEGMKVREGEVYIAIRQVDVVHIIKQSRIEGLVCGTDFGLLAYNETPAYEVIDRGITTLSIDWEKMGTLTADFILTGKQIHTYLPTEIRLRGSL